MALGELVDKIDAPTTRRTVVKTGVKLAYAAPLVAGTIKLSAMSAGAQRVSVVCPPNLVCGVVPAPCGEDASGVCSSVKSVDVNSCICGNDLCGPGCTTDADCQTYAPGSICQAPGTGCCQQACIAPCDAFDGSGEFDGSAAQVGAGSNSGK
jgi:hypothetical protein